MSDVRIMSNVPLPSVTSVPEYQLSGLPYCETKVNQGDSSFTELPRVSRWIMIQAIGADAKIFFRADDDDANKYFTVKAGETSQRLELRCTKVYFNQVGGAGNSVILIAGLTHIDKSRTVPESMLDFVVD